MKMVNALFFHSKKLRNEEKKMILHEYIFLCVGCVGNERTQINSNTFILFLFLDGDQLWDINKIQYSYLELKKIFKIYKTFYKDHSFFW